MHRCEVKVEHRRGAPTVACGDHANKKIGNVWLCDYHYASLRHIEEYDGRLKSVTDYTTSKD